MADLSVTAASVAKVAGAVTITGTAGEAITAGQAVYVSGTSYFLCDANFAAKDDCVGIALDNAALGQPVTVQTSGEINCGSSPVVGTVYCVSVNPGAIADHADLVTGNRVTVIGGGVSGTNLALIFKTTGITIDP